MTTEEQQQLAKIRHDLLIWVGYHRGTSISEEAMPRFHEIIDAISKLLPEMIIVQNGTCWACGEWGTDMRWWYVTVNDGQGKTIPNERKGYLLHKDSKCTRRAEQKVTMEVKGDTLP